MLADSGKHEHLEETFRRQAITAFRGFSCSRRERRPGERQGFLAVYPDLIRCKTFLGDTPLHVAAKAGREDVLDTLLAAKANINAKNDQSAMPLHHAASYTRIPSRCWLTITGLSSILLILRRMRGKRVVELLLANKANVNAATRRGWTPLHEAAVKGHKDVVEVLLANGANVHTKLRDNDKQTPLHLAAELGRTAVVQLLLNNKADVNAKDKRVRRPWLRQPVAATGDVVNLLRQHGGE